MLDVQRQYADGLITNGERYNKVVDIWAEVTENIADEMMKEMEAMVKGKEPFRPEIFSTNARDIQQAAPEITHLFPEGSLKKVVSANSPQECRQKNPLFRSMLTLSAELSENPFPDYEP